MNQIKELKITKKSFFDEATEINEIIKKFGFTQEELAEKTGRAQSTIANKLRLLKLSDDEKKIILKNDLTERHARALLKLASISDRMKILDVICENKLNVEETEKYISKFIGKTTVKTYRKRKKSDNNINKMICIINRAVNNIKYSGLSVESEKFENDKYIEYRVKIPNINQKA